MSGSINVRGYRETLTAPWGKLFYQLVWRHLDCFGKRILDFGSGFGVTADHLAEKNEVVAVEPNLEMAQNRMRENTYRQIVGSIEVLKGFQDNSFDVIVCHNVLEYMDLRHELLQEFCRLLKPDGFVSIVKHHRAGKIMQKVVFENNTEDALKLLEMGDVKSVNFGTIHEYNENELIEYSGGKLLIDKIYGLRMFYALQRNEVKFEDGWLQRMYCMEIAAEEIPEFRDIAFFHHIILCRKIER